MSSLESRHASLSARKRNSSDHGARAGHSGANGFERRGWARPGQGARGGRALCDRSDVAHAVGARGDQAIAKNVPDAVVGAGTIVSVEQINQAVAAGARFLVSPGAPPALAKAAAQAPVPFLPGCATASEAMALRELGFRALKLFPAEAAGGVKLLASLAAPLPDLRFCPTGGIDLEKAPEYLRLPNVPCVGGSWMLQKAALAAGDYLAVEALSREAAGLERASA